MESKDIISNKTSGQAIDPVIDTVAGRFAEGTYFIPGTDKKLNYQLYTPEDYDPAEKYPLVLFIHDAGSCSEDTKTVLTQGLGAVIWTTGEEQKKHKCFVLAPCYPTTCADDDFQVTPELEYTVELVREIVKRYSIDETRIYGTGQSMGCMMLCEMNLRYPKLFAGCLLVAGQWNPETMSACKNKNLWIIVSQRDRKAYPIMGACMESIVKAGGKVTRGALDAKASDEELRLEIEKLESDGNHIYFTWFEGDSVLPDDCEDRNPGAYHVMTWARAYDITSLRDWLFKQRKELEI